jgi:hypothetical protein
LDAEGNFWHEGAKVEHPGMARAFASWIGRHPDDGRYILNNGYDWTYFSVEDTPFFVLSVREAASGQGSGTGFELELSDGSVEPLTLETIELGKDGVCFASVKNGVFRARFSRSAQLALAPFLEEAPDGRIFLSFSGRRRELSSRP